MKLLLTAINAKYIHSNLGVYSLRRYALERHPEWEDNIHLAEFTINQQMDDILAAIYREQPDVVAFSCYIWNITVVEWLCAELPKILPEVDIWLGGPEVSFDAEERLKRWPAVTGIMIGEGEETFYELTECYQSVEDVEGEASIPKIPGTVFRTADGIVTNPPRNYLDLDSVPFPYEDLSGLEHRIIYYESSRGCPFGCSYCLSSVDRRVRLRSLDLVRQELQFFLDAGVPQVKFVDRTFNVDREHTRGILEYIRDHDNEITNFHFEIAAELLREEELELLTSLRPGLVQLEIGVQTVNTDTLEAICRKADLAQLTEIVGKLVAAGNMHIHLDLIAGLPYEDLMSFRHSFDVVYRMKPEQLQLGFLKVLKGSPLAGSVVGRKYDIVYREQPPYEVLCTAWLSYSDILELKQVEEMLEVYHNSGQFALSLKYLEHFYESPYEFYRQLAQYSEQVDWYGRKHNRYDWYTHLRAFWQQSHPEDEVLSVLLLHDLYARENSKSRPTWAPERNVPEEKERRKQFFVTGTFRKYLPDYTAYSSAQAARMVHLEQVDLDPFLTAESGKKVAWRGYLLYDYQRVHAVNHSADCQLVGEEVFV